MIKYQQHRQMLACNGWRENNKQTYDWHTTAIQGLLFDREERIN